MVQTIQQKIKIMLEQCRRVEKEATDRDVSPNRLVVELAMEAVERWKLPRTEAKIHPFHPGIFAAQAIARGMESTGRDTKFEQINRTITESRRNSRATPGILTTITLVPSTAKYKFMYKSNTTQPA